MTAGTYDAIVSGNSFEPLGKRWMVSGIVRSYQVSWRRREMSNVTANPKPKPRPKPVKTELIGLR